MATLVSFPVARKRHRCGGIPCGKAIEPGTRYCRSVVTPNDGDIGNTGWWTIRLCPPCAAYYRTPVPEAVAPSGGCARCATSHPHAADTHSYTEDCEYGPNPTAAALMARTPGGWSE
jgi:hypothetical protein